MIQDEAVQPLLQDMVSGQPFLLLSYKYTYCVGTRFSGCMVAPRVALPVCLHKLKHKKKARSTMLKKAMLIAVTIAMLFLCGCVAGQEPSPTTLSLAAADAQPAETIITEATEPAYPALLEEQVEDVVLSDTVPRCDTEAAHSFLLKSGEDNGYFESTYIHTFAKTTGNREPYDGQFFWMPRSEDDNRMQGNHYDVYIMEDGSLTKLESHSFFQEYTIFGQTVPLELEYAVYGEQVLLTYVPPENWSGNEARVCDYSRGADTCLVKFQLVPRQKGDMASCYFGIVDLHTGELKDFLSGFNADMFNGYSFNVKKWEENGNLLVANDANHIWRYYDAANGTFTEYDIKSAVGEEIEDTSLASDGIICWGKDAAWKYSFKDGSLTQIPNRSKSCCGDLPYYIYWEIGQGCHVYDFVTGEDTTITEAVSVFGCTERFVIFMDKDEMLCLYDTQKKTVAKLRERSEDWATNWRTSPDGCSICFFKDDENGVFQLLVFLADTNTLIELQRANSNGTADGFYLQWATEKKLIIGLETYQDFCVYDFTTS